MGWVFLAGAAPSPAAAFYPLYGSRRAPVKREAKTSCTMASAAQRCQTAHPETCAHPCALSRVFKAYDRAPAHVPGLERRTSEPLPCSLRSVLQHVPLLACQLLQGGDMTYMSGLGKFPGECGAHTGSRRAEKCLQQPEAK